MNAFDFPALETPSGHGSTSSLQAVVGGRLTFLGQLVQQATPLLTEEVGSCEAAVAADDAQVGDASLHQVEGGLQAALPRAERLAARAADHRAPLAERGHNSTLRH